MSNHAPSQQDFDELKQDHLRLRMLLVGIIPMVGILLERQGIEAAAVQTWKAAYPEVGFDASKWLNAGNSLMKQLSEQ